MSFTTKYNQEYISVVEKPDEKYHRYKVILHEADLCFHFATFDNTEQLEFFAQTVGFEYVPTGFEISERFGLRNEYQVNRRFKSIYFWYKEELPAVIKQKRGKKWIGTESPLITDSIKELNPRKMAYISTLKTNTSRF